MIRNNQLTYVGADSVFRNLRPQSDLLYEIIFAVLVTVFVYQLTKLSLELLLGQRRTGEIPVSDLYIYVILSGLTFFSIISFLRSLFQPAQDAQELALSTAMKSKMSGRAARMVTKFALLVLAVPGIQVLGLFLGLEGETLVSFRDVKFGGLAMGLVEDQSRNRKNDSSRCQKLETRLGHGETGVTDFFRCYGITEPLPFDTGNNLKAGSFVVLLSPTSTNIGVTVIVPGKRWLTFLSLDINDGQKPYSLRNLLTFEQQSRIFEHGVREMAKPCSSAVQTRGNDVSWVFPAQPESLSEQRLLSVLVECAEYNEDHLVKVADGMLSNVSFVQTDHFEIAESINAKNFTSGDDLVFFRRRGSNASLLAMLITTIVVITGRIVVWCLLINEAPKALEVILKDHLGLKCCDSMLQYEQKVHYRSHGQKPKLPSLISDIDSFSTAETESSTRERDSCHSFSSVRERSGGGTGDGKVNAVVHCELRCGKVELAQTYDAGQGNCCR
ncbi:hypothetical protein FGB62_136g00 [Gracilaria domingensis]|nr:hypothetical protein FGB62_136g00 [Gracilaria domingensis]